MLTKALEKQLINNHERQVSHQAVNEGSTLDIRPVVKFFGGSACSWLISEYDVENDIFFGLCDIGHGSVELGYISRSELQNIRFAPFNLPIERDLYQTFSHGLSVYTKRSKSLGYITTDVSN